MRSAPASSIPAPTGWRGRRRGPGRPVPDPAPGDPGEARTAPGEPGERRTVRRTGAPEGRVAAGQERSHSVRDVQGRHALASGPVVDATAEEPLHRLCGA